MLSNYVRGIAGSAEFLNSVQSCLCPYLLQGSATLVFYALLSLLVVELFVLRPAN